jgi:tRNA dimethylallyltransferase
MNASSKSRVVVVVGATTSGKTTLAVEIALALDGEIVNGDSRLFYRWMDIATAKPTALEMRGVPHHLIDILDPSEHYSLANYLKHARSLIDEITSRGKLPIVVGGSGQYIWALIEGWEVPEIEPNEQLRAELEERLASSGVEPLASDLTSIAPDVAADTDLLNPRRVIRALERVNADPDGMATGRRKADVEPFNIHMIGLSAERSVLHQRVLDRLDSMLAAGWKSEVESLLAAGYSKDDRSLSGIGYRQMIDHLAGEIDIEEAARRTAVATNRLIRQQNNWFRQDDPRISWYDATTAGTDSSKLIIDAAMKWRHNS